jgi:peptide/nickel transport system substrate-binding protein
MPLRKYGWIALALLIVCSLLLAACGQAEEATEAPAPEETTAEQPAEEEPAAAEPEEEEPAAAEPEEEEPVAAEPEEEEPAGEVKEKNITVTFLSEPDTLNPLYAGSWFAEMANYMNQANLWFIEENGEILLDLAAEYPSLENGGLSEDGKTITIRLKDNIEWSDGTPITAHDMVFTYETVVAEGNSLTRFPWDTYVESITAEDDQTLVMVLTEPYVDWNNNFYKAGNILPRHILEPVYEAEGTLDNAEWNRLPTVSSGPFVVTEWVAGSHISLEANDNYWRGRPNLDHIFIRMAPDRATQNAALAAGDSDIGSYILGEDVPALQDIEGLELKMTTSGYVMPLFFNIDPETANPGMTELDVRRALVYALDRQQIIDELNYGLYEIPTTWWHNTIWDNPDLEPLPFDPAMAEELLEGAGWSDTNGDGTRDKDGVELVLRYAASPGAIDSGLAVVVQQMLGDVGIGVEIVPTSLDILWAGMNDGGPLANGEFELTSWGDGMWYFPSPYTDYFVCDMLPSPENPDNYNWWGVCDERLDELFAAQGTEVDQQQRIAMYHEIGQIMHDNVYITYLYDTPEMWAVSSRVKNFKLSGANSLYNCFEWDVED